MTNNPIIIRKPNQKVTFTPSDLRVTPVFDDTSTVILKYQQASWDLFNSLPYPTEKDEHWKRTSLKGLSLQNLSLQPSTIYPSKPFSQDSIKVLTDQAHGGQVIITPSGVEKYLDRNLVERGVVFADLRTVARENPELIEKLLTRVDHKKHGKFFALAGSFAKNGVVLYVPKGVQVEEPLQSFYWAPGEEVVHSSHVLVYLEDGASATLVHESSSPSGEKGINLHLGLMEIYVGPGSVLKFVELQSWGENVWNFTRENVEVDRDGNIDWIFGALGSLVTKNFSDLNLVGQGSSGKISGFYFANQNQHLDHDTQQNHLAPNTTSDLLFKGALTGQSRSVWQGMIYVAPMASKTDGYQANRNLILSENARADSNPGLEILTDDVRCTHGATIGKIDKDQVFYLQSRGMTREAAERLIVEGFYDPIMQRIPFEGVRTRFQKAIKEKMEHIGSNN